MEAAAEAREMILDLLEETALIVGGLVAVTDVPDEFVWRLMRSLDVIRHRALKPLAENGHQDDPESQAETSANPHPAIEEFLLKLHRK